MIYFFKTRKNEKNMKNMNKKKTKAILPADGHHSSMHFWWTNTSSGSPFENIIWIETRLRHVSLRPLANPLATITSVRSLRESRTSQLQFSISERISRSASPSFT